MTTWDELQQLAAELQASPVTTQSVKRQSGYKLSSYHCIELVNMLIKRGLVNVVFTLDGKEYVTNSRLKEEIIKYCQKKKRVNRNLIPVDFQVSRNVVDSLMPSILADNSNGFSELKSDIISSDYLSDLAESIDELVSNRTCVTLSEIAEKFELSPSLVQQIIKQNLRSAIHGIFDKDSLYTEFHVSKYAAIIKGALQASLVPFNLNLLKNLGLKLDLIKRTTEDLLKDHSDIVFDGKSNTYFSKAFITNLRSLLAGQNVIRDSFLVNIGFTSLEFLLPLSHICDVELIRLSACYVTEPFMAKLVSHINESLRNVGYCDVTSYASDLFTDEDATKFHSFCRKYSDVHAEEMAFIKCDYVFKKSFFEDIKSCIDGYASKMAEEIANQNFSKNSSERGAGANRNSASLANGSQGKNMICKFEVDCDELLNVFESTFNLPRPMSEALVSHFLKDVKQNIEKKIEAMYNSHTIAPEPEIKDCFKIKQEKLKKQIAKLNVLHKDLLSVKDAKLVEECNAFMLKTVCTNLVNFAVFTVCTKDPEENMPHPVSHEKRTAWISSCDRDTQKIFKSIIESLKLKSVDEFLKTSMNDIMSLAGLRCQKHVEFDPRAIHEELRVETLEHLKEVDDLADALHTCVVLLYFYLNNIFLTVPGKCVQKIISLIRPHLTEEEQKKVDQCYARVLILYKQKKNLVIQNKAGEDYDKLQFLKQLGSKNFSQ